MSWNTAAWEASATQVGLLNYYMSAMEEKTSFRGLMIWKSWIICGALSVLALLSFVVSLFDGVDPDLPWYERAPFTPWLYGVLFLILLTGAFVNCIKTSRDL